MPDLLVKATHLNRQSNYTKQKIQTNTVFLVNRNILHIYRGQHSQAIAVGGIFYPCFNNFQCKIYIYIFFFLVLSGSLAYYCYMQYHKNNVKIENLVRLP